VEDANEAVAKRAECLVMQVAGGAVGVVEGSAAWARPQGAECPLVNRVVERRLRIWRASTARFSPDAMVMGDVRHSSCKTSHWHSGSVVPELRRAPGRRARHQVLAGKR
jgi:hypothetical protein